MQVPPRWRARIDNATAIALQAEFLGTLLFVFAAGERFCAKLVCEACVCPHVPATSRQILSAPELYGAICPRPPAQVP